MKLQKLQVLNLIAKTHKVTETAELLGLRQPTVTFHMQSLEKEAGAKLFEQSHGYVGLTEAGKALLHYAKDILFLMDEAQRTVDELGTLKRGRLIIGSSYVPATYLLPGVLLRFTDAFPHIRVELHVQPYRQLLDMLLRHEVDFGLGYTAEEALEDFVCRPIGTDELVAVYSPHSGLPVEGSLGLDQLRRHTLVQHGPDSSTRRIVEKWMARENISFDSRMDLDSIEAIKHVLFLSDHFSILSRLAVAREVERGELAAKSLPPKPLLREMNLVYLRNRYLSPAAQKFIEYVCSSLPPALDYGLVKKDMKKSVGTMQNAST